MNLTYIEELVFNVINFLDDIDDIYNLCLTTQDASLTFSNLKFLTVLGKRFKISQKPVNFKDLYYLFWPQNHRIGPSSALYCGN